MLDFIKRELCARGIYDASCISLGECLIQKEHLLRKAGISEGSVIIFTVPYLTPDSLCARNISRYAASRDYHAYFEGLFKELTEKLAGKYPDNKFVGFSDHSPINEVHAAARAGLGVIGGNRLLITSKYSSFVFIGEIITDAELPSSACEIRKCEGCGACEAGCAVSLDISRCLSAITQKKGELSPAEAELIRQSGCAWGCDVCQLVCPHTKRALADKSIFTNIDFFKSDITQSIDKEFINSMSDEDFASRAYSWRGRSVLIRNLDILEREE